MNVGYIIRRIGVFLIIVWVAATLNCIIPRLAPEHPTGRNLAGSVVESAFYCDLSRRIGLASLRDTFFHSDGMHDQYRVWTNTSPGADWMRWYRECQERGTRAQP